MEDRAHRTNHDLHWDLYRGLRNSITNDIRNAKKSYYGDHFSLGFSGREKWKVLNELLGQKTRQVNNLVPPADKLNTFFANTCIVYPDMINTSDSLPNTVLDKFAFQPASDDAVIKTICRLPRKASEGIDGINTCLLQLSLPITLPYIRHVFDTSIATNSFPSLLKKAIITPIYKGKGSRSEPGDYRPIATLPVISRVLEKLILKQVFTYMDKHSILTDCQHAFRKKHSVETALLEVTDQIWIGMDKTQVTTDVLVDLSKAFDKVDRKILLDKMTKCGICCDWFWSYLTGRTQAVQQDDTLSEFLPTSSGVPQGSYLGPVLFSVYPYDLPQHISSNVVMYADVD